MVSPEHKTPSIDFDLSSSSSTTASAEDFFPINCTFNSAQNLAGLIHSSVVVNYNNNYCTPVQYLCDIKEVLDDEVEDIKWSFESKLNVEKYEIV
ncbi:hypothetical protein BLA29_007665 [Euroglyphus maynei]|uniref:Uncharacterized protein n=1 Tax=Euroglyphus maynei TaxID=6958 RepID=A0A1Y3B4G5_EURMA|nr:hypothetical protein BLA29_007665 [Euroglyphus maynei]